MSVISLPHRRRSTISNRSVNSIRSNRSTDSSKSSAENLQPQSVASRTLADIPLNPRAGALSARRTRRLPLALAGPHPLPHSYHNCYGSRTPTAENAARALLTRGSRTGFFLRKVMSR
jgi:hypothetical protein